MAKQKGIIPIEGTLGNITFFKSKDGYMIREKGGVSAQRIASDPAFARTRENMAEFGKAGKAVKVLRSVLSSIIQGSTDARMWSRLTKKMMEVLKMDLTSVRGQRGVIDGETALLEGFEFNVNGPLGSTLLAPFSFSFNRVTGAALFEAAAFVPAVMLAPPGGATHFRIRTAAALVNFESGTGEISEGNTGYLPINNAPGAPLSLSMQLVAASTHPAFCVINIEFVQDVNGVKYALQNGASNACTIVKVDTGV